MRTARLVVLTAATWLAVLAALSFSGYLLMTDRYGLAWLVLVIGFALAGYAVAAEQKHYGEHSEESPP